MRQRQPRQHDEAHLKFIRELPCVVCGNNIETQAAHVRMPDLTIAKPVTGIAMKPHDMFTVPLCGRCHDEQHHRGDEGAWWKGVGLDPVKIALALFIATGDFERAEHIALRSLR